MSKHRLPPTANVARDAGGGRLVLPAAERNKEAIATLVADLMDGATGATALEIASGSGQHIVEHARRNPGVTWQPTDVDPARLTSIDAYAAEAGLANIRPAALLDATCPGWSATHNGLHLVLLANLLHLISDDETAALIAEAGRALAPGGHLFIYGPFMRGGELTSEGDRRFHAELTGADPAIGYKDDFDITDLIHCNGMELVRLVDMPANNLSFIARRTF
jgi:SAM-dependent methyltransferase